MSQAAQAIVVDSGQAILAGASAGDVVECGIGPEPRLRRIGGFDGVAVQSLAVAPDALTVIASDMAGNVRVWRRADGETIDSWKMGLGAVQCAVIGPREYLTMDSQGHGSVWTPGAGGDLKSFTVARDASEPCSFNRFAVRPGGERVTLLSGFDWMVWDRSQNTVVAEQDPLEGVQLMYLAGQIGLSANGRFYFAYWDDYTVVDTVTGAEVLKEDILFSPTGAAISGDAQTLVLGAREGKIVAVGQDGEARMETKSGDAAIRRISLSEDGRIAAFVNSEGAAGAVDIVSGTVLLDPSRLGEMLDRL